MDSIRLQLTTQIPHKLDLVLLLAPFRELDGPNSPGISEGGGEMALSPVLEAIMLCYIGALPQIHEYLGTEIK